MMQLNKLIRSVLSLSVALAVLFCMPLSGIAATGTFPDLSSTGSITLTLEDSDGNIVSGGEISLYEVAYLYLNSGSMTYAFTKQFENCTADLDVTDTSLAAALAQYVEDYHVSGDNKVLGSDGTVTFDNLELGLYLVVQASVSDGGETFNPFVVTVPLEVDGEWEYAVDASPKPEVVSATDHQETEKSEETTKTEETTGSEETTYPDETTDFEEPTVSEGTTDPEESDTESDTTPTLTVLPQTGQLNWPIPVLAVGGILLFAFGWFLKESDRKRQDV